MQLYRILSDVDAKICSTLEIHLCVFILKELLIVPLFWFHFKKRTTKNVFFFGVNGKLLASMSNAWDHLQCL